MIVILYEIKKWITKKKSVIKLKNKILTNTNSNQSITINKNTYDNIINLNLVLKRNGMSIGHLNVQGINSKQNFSD